MKNTAENLQHSMLQDACEAALRIADDLGLKPGNVDLENCIYLCERHGGKPEYVALRPGLLGCCYVDTGDIEISRKLTKKQRAPVILHELAHRMAFSPRYEEFNQPHFAEYPFNKFHELIALSVEVLFVMYGGIHFEKRFMKGTSCPT